MDTRLCNYSKRGLGDKTRRISFKGLRFNLLASSIGPERSIVTNIYKLHFIYLNWSTKFWNAALVRKIPTSGYFWEKIGNFIWTTMSISINILPSLVSSVGVIRIWTLATDWFWIWWLVNNFGCAEKIFPNESVKKRPEY